MRDLLQECHREIRERTLPAHRRQELACSLYWNHFNVPPGLLAELLQCRPRDVCSQVAPGPDVRCSTCGRMFPARSRNQLFASRPDLKHLQTTPARLVCDPCRTASAQAVLEAQHQRWQQEQRGETDSRELHAAWLEQTAQVRGEILDFIEAHRSKLSPAAADVLLDMVDAYFHGPSTNDNE